MSDFWLQALLGGALIGLASAMLLLGAGRIAGASGIFRHAIEDVAAGRFAGVAAERLAFLGGLVAAPVLYAGFGGHTPFAAPAPLALMAVGGFIVGVGVRLGNGCTSGHGVCGLSRFSVRSVVATATFMAVCAATVFVVRHVVGV